MPYVYSVGVSIPDFFASNEYVKELILTESEGIWNGELRELSDKIDSYFMKTGAKTRTWRNSNSFPKEHIMEAVKHCLEGTSFWHPEKLSSVIYCGIDRGFVEPAHASVLAARLGLEHVRAFDVSDACLGWYTSCEAARAFACDNKPLSLIISGEFPIDMPGKVYPNAFRVRDVEVFKWKSAAFTLG